MTTHTTTGDPMDTIPPIKPGTRWVQHHTRKGTLLKRLIEVIAAPKLSSPVGYRIVRNDAHPHREGKFASIRVADLRRKYTPEVAS